jgi:phthalate 4,5-cis-dihydrodiol dehydrogenase
MRGCESALLPSWESLDHVAISRSRVSIDLASDLASDLATGHLATGIRLQVQQRILESDRVDQPPPRWMGRPGMTRDTASVSDPAPSEPGRVVNLGIVGLGVGAARILSRIESNTRIRLVAGADTDPGVRDAFRARYRLPAYRSMAELCAHADLEAVWIASPDRFHRPHAIMAAEKGKHVIVEKPMATSLEEAEQMVAAAQAHQVALVCGHTHACSAAIRTMLNVIRSGEIGALCAMHAFSYTDWMLRPRTAHELDPARGGGVVLRQGPHQVDAVRLLGGGMVRSVRAMTGQWMPERAIPGYYCALLVFEDGTPAMLTYNGYGYFVTNELVPWGTQRARYTPEERLAARRALRQGARDEASAKREMGIGGVRERDIPGQGQDKDGWLPADLGVVVVSCERGDMRHSRRGIYVYDDRGRTEYLDGEGETAGEKGHDALDELYGAVVLKQPIFHDGAWGMATLEVCLAIEQSAREQKEILLSHQIPTPSCSVHRAGDVPDENGAWK